jgi:hypothetical protein
LIVEEGQNRTRTAKHPRYKSRGWSFKTFASFNSQIFNEMHLNVDFKSLSFRGFCALSLFQLRRQSHECAEINSRTHLHDCAICTQFPILCSVKNAPNYIISRGLHHSELEQIWGSNTTIFFVKLLNIDAICRSFKVSIFLLE